MAPSPSARRSRAGVLLVLLGAALGDYIEADTFPLVDPSTAAVQAREGNEVESGASRVEPIVGSSLQPRDACSPTPLLPGKSGPPAAGAEVGAPGLRPPSGPRIDAVLSSPDYLRPYLPSGPHSRRAPPA